jgi:hypothetical protein
MELFLLMVRDKLRKKQSKVSLTKDDERGLDDHPPNTRMMR